MQVAPNQISPGEPFDIFYFVRNPLDSTTYFVRAKVYDVRTGELLSTIALDQSPTNARLFIKTTQAPADPSGYGRNIVAIASVYLDSGFTQQSDSYEEQEQYYLIKAMAPMLGGGGVDMRAFREMMEEVVTAKLAGLPKPAKPQEFPSDALFGAIGALQREINRVPKEFDTSALSARLDAIQEAISAIREPEKPDLSPIVDALNSALFEIEQLKPFVQHIGAAITAAQERLMKEQGAALLGEVETGLKDLMGRQELTVPFSSLMKEKQPTPSPIDVAHLM